MSAPLSSRNCTRRMWPWKQALCRAEGVTAGHRYRRESGQNTAGAGGGGLIAIELFISFLVGGGGAGDLTCVSISALIVDAHRILARQELHHFHVFAVGARADITGAKKHGTFHLTVLEHRDENMFGQYLWNAVSLKMFSFERLSAPDS